MSTKSTTVVKSAAEIKYERRVKSVELAIRSQGNKGILSETLTKVAGHIFTYLNS